MAKIKGSYFPDEEYFFSDDETKIVTFVEMLKARGCTIGADWHIRSARGGMMSKLTRNGYYLTGAQYNKKMYYFCEHRVIWVWIKGSIPKGMEINHIDFNRGNNNISNLELVTHSENMRHSKPNLNPPRGEISGKAKYTNKQAAAIKLLSNVFGWSKKNIAEFIGGASPANIGRIVNGKRYPDVVEPASVLEAYPIIVDWTRNKNIPPIEELKNYCLGLCGETGEVIDMVKKWLYHGKELNQVELALELGDVLYYLVAISNVLGLDFDLVALNNNAKLLGRYKDGFSEKSSNERVEEQLGVIDGNGDNR